MNYCFLAMVAMNLLLGREVESWDENYRADPTSAYTDYDGYDNVSLPLLSSFTDDFSVEKQMVVYDWEITDSVDIGLLLKENQTIQFLSSFVSEFERWAISQQLLSCPYISLCEFSLNLNLSERRGCCEPCECNYPHCLITKTCCLDIIFKNKNNTTENMSSLVTKNCIPLTFPTQMNRNVNVFGYNVCPDNGMQFFKDNCTMIYDSSVASLSDVVPVVHKGTLDLYRNRFCAYCHNLTDADVEYLKVQIRCIYLPYDLNAESNILSAVFKQGSCWIEFKTEADLNYCSPAISDCNVTGMWNQYDRNTELMCKLYRSHVENMHVFQNVFCSACNGITHDQSLCHATQISTIKEFSNEISFMNVLFEVPKDSSQQTNNCSEDQLYDRFTETCKDLFCSPITSLQNGRCIEVPQDTSDVVYTSYLRLIPKRSLLTKEAYLVAEEVIQYIHRTIFDNMCGIQIVYQTDLFVANVTSALVLNSKLLYYDVRIQLHYNHSQMTQPVVEQVLDLHKTVFTIQVPFLPGGKLEFSILVKDDYLSIYEKTLYPKSDSYSDLSDTFVVLPLPLLLREYEISKSDDKQQLQARFLHLRRRDLLGTCPTDALQLNVLHLDPCPKVKVSKRDIDWIVSDDGLVFELGNYQLDSHKFYLIDETTIAMCAKIYEQFLQVFGTEANSGFSPEVIVSIVSLSCSILCLICTFTTFCLFCVLRRSIPGKNNMSLVLVLMLAQITFLVASVGGLKEGSIACKAVGILVHLLLLSFMFWMNVCTYHMFQVLTKVQVLSQSGSKKKFAFYHVYAFLMAAIFVSINIVVSHAIFGNVGYGSKACYISSQTMIIFTFCIPVIFVVLANVGMFTYVVVKIKKMPSVQKNVQKERNDIVVFVKLSTITGATWIFGIINVWLNHPVLSYIFILLNAGQGVFIMFAFVVNRRVYNLFRELILGEKLTSGTSHMSTKSSQI